MSLYRPVTPLVMNLRLIERTEIDRPRRTSGERTHALTFDLSFLVYVKDEMKDHTNKRLHQSHPEKDRHFLLWKKDLQPGLKR